MEDRPLIPKVVDGKIIITKKSDYDEVRLTIDKMEDVMNNCYSKGRADERAKILTELQQSVYCNYNGDCMADRERCTKCSNYVVDWSDVESLVEELNNLNRSLSNFEVTSK